MIISEKSFKEGNKNGITMNLIFINDQELTQIIFFSYFEDFFFNYSFLVLQ